MPHLGLKNVVHDLMDVLGKKTRLVGAGETDEFAGHPLQVLTLFSITAETLRHHPLREI